MEEVDIFANAVPLTGEFWGYAKIGIGAKIQGTYIDLRVGAGFQGKGTQNNYWIKTADGIKIVGGKFSIDQQMEGVKFGQIVGFQYTGEKETKFGMQHVVEVYADPRYRDEEWLKGQDGLREVVARVESEGEDKEDYVEAEEPVTTADVEKAFDFSTPAQPASEPFLTDSEQKAVLGEISALAKAKLGAEGQEEVKEAVMEATGLPFLKSNLGKIVEAMRALKG